MKNNKSAIINTAAEAADESANVEGNPVPEKNEKKRAAAKNSSQKNGRLLNGVFNRMTSIIILGLFVLLTLSSLITFGLSTIIAHSIHISEDNIWLFGIIVMVMSIVFGLILSAAYWAIMIKASKPYLEAIQRVAECDFSVRIKDSPILSNLGIAEQFNNMMEQLASVETLRDNFVSDFSHEFKTPIVSIAGFATLLKDKNLTEDERNEYLDVIIDESHRLVDLSESVLLLSRLDSQVIVNEPFLLDEQLRQCVLLFARQCSSKNIKVEADFDDGIAVTCCKKLLSQVWVNLLSNAVKFTPEGGTITVSVAQSEQSVTVAVADTGCGMSDDVKDKVFIKFFQGDKSRTTSGNGLGLSVVKKICDLLSLTIRIESEVGVGSKFIVTIPVE